jgi:hypothetical protein
MDYFSYIHCKPDGVPFYVGKGVRTRYKNFKERSVYHKRVVDKHGADNILIGKLDCSTNDIALQLEVGLIKCLRRMGVRLVNLTDGGEGNVGWKCPEKVKLAVAEANRRRVWSKEQREKIGAVSRGKKRPDHSAFMKGRFVGINNPVFGSGGRQRGAKNHSAKVVSGVNGSIVRTWATLTDASIDLGVSIQAICQSIKKKHRSKGWVLEYKNGL